MYYNVHRQYLALNMLDYRLISQYYKVNSNVKGIYNLPFKYACMNDMKQKEYFY